MKSKEKKKYYLNTEYSKSPEFWYEYIYDARELPLYSDFQKDQYNVMKNITDSGQMLRYACILACSLNIVLNLLAWPLMNMIYYFTNWTLLLTFYSIYYSSITVCDLEINKKVEKMAIHHLLYTSSIIFNFITVSVYWILIHSEIKIKFGGI